tara:strand:- start:160 stop:336 length:177 start_codon:yes stop_codon:yes gene_type:complete
MTKNIFLDPKNLRKGYTIPELKTGYRNLVTKETKVNKQGQTVKKITKIKLYKKNDINI